MAYNCSFHISIKWFEWWLTFFEYDKYMRQGRWRKWDWIFKDKYSDHSTCSKEKSLMYQWKWSLFIIQSTYYMEGNTGHKVFQTQFGKWRQPMNKQQESRNIIHPALHVMMPFQKHWISKWLKTFHSISVSLIPRM